MKYVAAYLLATLGGNVSPTTKDIEKILAAGKVNVDAEKAKTVVEALKGKSIEDVIAAGTKKLASVPSGGGAAPAAAAAAAPAAQAAAPAAAKKEEKKEESEDEDMGFGLFD